MNWVEFIGLPGIGKTTFKKDLIKKRKSSNQWVTSQEALYEIVRNSGAKRFGGGTFGQMFQFYFSQNFINRNKHLIYNLGIDRAAAFGKEAEKYNFLMESYLDYMNSVGNQTGIKKASSINLYRTIIEEMSVYDFYGYEKLVLLEKGPTAYNFNYKKVDWKKSDIFPKGYIFFELDVNSHFTRIREREKKGVIRNVHAGLNDIELKESIKRNHKKITEKRDFLIDQEIPFIVIDLKDRSSENIDETNQFLSGIQKQLNI